MPKQKTEDLIRKNEKTIKDCGDRLVVITSKLNELVAEYGNTASELMEALEPIKDIIAPGRYAELFSHRYRSAILIKLYAPEIGVVKVTEIGPEVLVDGLDQQSGHRGITLKDL